MSKAKIAKKSTAIDMTPMVDLAFLLITFFMLTVKFRPQESVEVSTPSSTAETPLPNSDVMIITIAKDGRVFFAVDSKNTRMEMLDKIARRYDLGFDEKQRDAFGVQPDVGVPIEKLQSWLDIRDPERRKEASEGIPVDTANTDKNQLKDWVIYGRLSNPKMRIAVKADAKASYTIIKNVINTLQNKPVNINKFNLITSAEAAPEDAKK